MTPDEKREYMRRWWLAHPDYKKQYRAARRTPEAIRRAALTPEQVNATHLEAARRWKREHRKENNAAKMAWHHRTKVLHPRPLKYKTDKERYDAQLAANRRAYHRNREDRLARRRAWAKKNPDRNRAIKRQAEVVRRARKLGADGHHTLREWNEKVLLFAGCCVYCGEAKPLTRDHDVPLTRGGSDNIANILPACRSCNSKKGTRTAREYLALRAA